MGSRTKVSGSFKKPVILLIWVLAPVFAGCNTKAIMGYFGLVAGDEMPICNPFGGGGTTIADGGLKGRLTFAPDPVTGATYANVADFQTNGIVVPNPVVVGDLNVPTVLFDSGFAPPGGTPLTSSPGGAILIEYFSLLFQSKLRLAPAQTSGDFQLGLISDDGSYLKANGTLVIDSDHYQATTLTCAMQPVALTPGSNVPIEVGYFQGPKFHIALMLLMRPWPAPELVNDPACGQGGNSYFFDSSVVPSAPTTAFNEMLARGWSIVGPANYKYPDDTLNPCATQL